MADGYLPVPRTGQRGCGRRQPAGQWGNCCRHPSELRHALFSPNQTHILTAGREGTARLWRLAREQALAKELPHPGAVAVLALSPDGKQVLTGCHESEGQPGESRLWDAATGAALGLPCRNRARSWPWPSVPMANSP